MPVAKITASTDTIRFVLDTILATLVRRHPLVHILAGGTDTGGNPS